MWTNRSVLDRKIKRKHMQTFVMEMGVCLQTEAIEMLGTYNSYDKQIANNKDFIRLIIDARAPLNIWDQRWLPCTVKYKYLRLLTHVKVYVRCLYKG